MITYILLNIIVFTLLSIFLCASPVSINKRSFFLTLIILFVTTIMFDSLIIAANIVGYNVELTLNIHLLKAPVEDFAYSLVAAIFVPYFWERLGSNGAD